MKYRHVVVATGLGSFPIDMLRYDGCLPATEEDARLIEQSFSELVSEFGKRPILIKKVSRFKTYEEAFTVERWKSFGWEISSPDVFDRGRLRVVRKEANAEWD